MVLGLSVSDYKYVDQSNKEIVYVKYTYAP